MIPNTKLLIHQLSAYDKKKIDYKKKVRLKVH